MRMQTIIATLIAVLALALPASAQTASQIQGTGPLPRAGARVILITGSTDGLGRATAKQLAASGAHIIVHGRSKEKADSVLNEINREGKGSARYYLADFASLAQVRAFAAAILRDYQRIDVLVNNAGIGSRVPETRTLSADGHELRFAVNYLSGFLLTRTLLPLLEKSAPARIVSVSSLSQSPVDFNDVMIQQNYSGNRAYGQSKLAQIMMTFDLARELAGKNILVNACHPATYMPTNMVRMGGFEPQATIEEGVEAVLNLVNTPNIGTGQYFVGTVLGRRANAQAYDEAARERLRKLTVELTGAK